MTPASNKKTRFGLKALARPKLDKWPIRWVVSLLVMLPTSAIAVIVAWLALKTTLTHKTADAWSLLLLQLDGLSLHIQQHISNHAQNQGPSLSSKYNLSESQKFLVRVQGDLPLTISLDDLGTTSFHSNFEASVYNLNGLPLLIRPTPGAKDAAFVVTPIDFGRFILPLKDTGHTSIYIANRDGKLIFTNDDLITPQAIMRKPLVLKFIVSPLQVGQLSFFDQQSQTNRYGFFKEIPSTNIVIFAEAAAGLIMDSVLKLAMHLSMIFAAILLFTFVIVQFPLVAVTRPLKTLANLARRVGEGEFTLEVASTGIGEVRVLSHAFRSMTTGLKERELRIRDLMEEQKKKIRLEQELSIAQTIQENFLVDPRTMTSLGLDVAAIYIPAEMVAGDWYGIKVDQDLGEAVIAVADVSGHGVGSAMFTAMIAGLFEEHWRAKNGDFKLQDFLLAANAIFLRFGAGNYYATMQILHLNTKTKQASLANCGHPFPILIDMKNEKKPVRQLAIAGEALGLTLDYAPSATPLDVNFPFTMVMYSDCLIESVNREGKQYGTRNLTRSLSQTQASHNATHLLGEVLSSWREYRQETPTTDDLSVVVIKVPA